MFAAESPCEQAGPETNIVLMGGQKNKKLFGRLDAVWKRHRIVAKAAKVVKRTRDGTALGIDSIGGTCLIPKRSRLRDITSSLISLLSEQKSSPKEFGHFFGVLQWLLLLNRPMLA